MTRRPSSGREASAVIGRLVELDALFAHGPVPGIPLRFVERCQLLRCRAARLETLAIELLARLGARPHGVDLPARAGAQPGRHFARAQERRPGYDADAL